MIAKNHQRQIIYHYYIEISKIYVPKFLVIFKSELNNKLKLQNKIKENLKNDKLIIRSSSLNEDNKKQSNAGKYLSILNVKKLKMMFIKH